MRFIPFSFPRENISRIFHLTFHFTFHLNVHLAFSPHFSTENPAFVFENSRRIHCAVPPRVASRFTDYLWGVVSGQVFRGAQTSPAAVRKQQLGAPQAAASCQQLASSLPAATGKLREESLTRILVRLQSLTWKKYLLLQGRRTWGPRPCCAEGGAEGRLP